MSSQNDNESTVPTSSGTANNNDGKAVLETMAPPAPAVREMGWNQIREMGWMEQVGISFFVVVYTIFILSAIGIVGDCPVLLLRAILQIAIVVVMLMDTLLIIRCRQIMGKRNMPRVLAEAAKLPPPDTPEVREFRLAKGNACLLCGIRNPVMNHIWIRYQDETIQLPRSPMTDEEEAGMYAVLINDDHHVIVGDRMEVVLLDNDPSKALYLPFQEQCLQDHAVSIARSALFLLVAMPALSWTGPVFYARPSQLEAALSWSSCSISRTTMVEYYVILLVPLILIGATMAMRKWRVAKAIKERSEQRESESEQSLLGDAEIPKLLSTAEAMDAESARQIV
jgi:hypothetical protein